MLVLTRRNGEAVVVPELGIEVTVLDTRAGRVRLAIEAPAELRIVRKELVGDGDAMGERRAARDDGERRVLQFAEAACAVEVPTPADCNGPDAGRVA